MLRNAPHESPSTYPDPEAATASLGPSRRVCYVALLAIIGVCSLAPFRGITFVLLGLSAVELPNLPLAVRFVALSASFSLVALGVFRVLNSV